MKSEYDYSLSQIGIIKKALEKEKNRLIENGIRYGMKPIWQAIHDAMHNIKLRDKKERPKPLQKKVIK